MGHVSFRGAYALFGDFARLERALMHYAFEKLTQNVRHHPWFHAAEALSRLQGFKMVSVPDIIHRGIIVKSFAQVYPPTFELCFARVGILWVPDQRETIPSVSIGLRWRIRPVLSGWNIGNAASRSSETQYFSQRWTPTEVCLPRKSFSPRSLGSLSFRLAACSRCYRAELPGGKSEGNLYRVHEFTKVEMFAVTADDHKLSEEMHNEIIRLQTSLFEGLGLHFRWAPRLRCNSCAGSFLEFWICPPKNLACPPIASMTLKRGCQPKNSTEK